MVVCDYCPSNLLRFTSCVSINIMRPLLRYKGGIAQLGERLHGMQEVSGSIPLISTKYYDWVVISHDFCPHRLEA